MTCREHLDDLAINTLRFLACDAIEEAKSGHPGMPLGAAAAAYTLWTRHLRHDPGNPTWFNRDRFVLSAGHASMLLYSLLHLTGYDISLEDLRSFRKWGSRTPGHPEHNPALGVEMTTGPLGQGIASAVGMAAAEAHLAARYNREGFEIINHWTYVLASDGDLMEGVSCEACSLAGHLGLGRLIVLYDSNDISLSGSTALCFTEDVAMRFAAAGWQVEEVKDGNDTQAVDAAIRRAKEEGGRPSLIILKTKIGFGAPAKQGTFEAHGAPLGKEELEGAKKGLGWPLEPRFFVPPEVKTFLEEEAGKKGVLSRAWEAEFLRYVQCQGEAAAELSRRIKGQLPPGWDGDLPVYPDGAKDISTRKVSEEILALLAARLPEMVGGAADLNPSTFTWLKGLGDFQNPRIKPASSQGCIGGSWGYEGRNIHFGVREHAMAAMASGLALHGGIIPFTATFLTFSDYMKPSLRLAALMKLKIVYVFTHDSIGLGEDGPTHQPVEQIMNLRSLPGLTVIRPADANETVEAWRQAILNEGPTALIFTRQNVPVINRTGLAAAGELARGGYVLWESGPEDPELIVIGVGSELHLSLAAGRRIAGEGNRVRVVSLPSWELFEGQREEYRNRVLPGKVRKRLAVEAGIKIGWERYVGLDGAVIGLSTFGASAPWQVLYEKFGITVDGIVAEARGLLIR